VNESRGAWLSFCIGLIVFFILGLRVNLIRIRQVAVILICTIFLAMAGMPYLQERLKSGFQDPGAQSRIPLMELAIEVIKSNPILGVGLNNYRFEMKKYKPDWLEIPWFSTVHNQYLLVWAETGIIGLFAFLVMLMLTVRKGILALKYRFTFAPVVMGFVAALFSFLVHMLFDTFGETWIIWGSMGAIVSLYRHSGLENSSGQPRGNITMSYP
jgi:O-antigen ligase